MRGLRRLIAVLALILIVPAAAYARLRHFAACVTDDNLCGRRAPHPHRPARRDPTRHNAMRHNATQRAGNGLSTVDERRP